MKYYGVSFYTIIGYANRHNIQLSSGVTGGGKKKIAQLDKNDDIIHIFDSIAEASRAFNKEPKNSAIRDVLRNKCKSAYGFKWKYVCCGIAESQYANTKL